MMGLMEGMTSDVTVDDIDGKPWDFNDPIKRSKAKEMVINTRATLIIGSPMCSAFSKLQSMNFARMTEDETKQATDYGTKHLELCAELYKLQQANGLYGLHEHPWEARSWKNDKMQGLLRSPDVTLIKSHQPMNDVRETQGTPIQFR